MALVKINPLQARVHWDRSADRPTRIRVAAKRNAIGVLMGFELILNAANRVRAFPELLAGEEKALSLLNRIARMRLAPSVRSIRSARSRSPQVTSTHVPPAPGPAPRDLRAAAVTGQPGKPALVGRDPG